MYMYSTCMQRGSLHRHIVDVVLCLMVVIGAIVTCLLCKVWLLIVTNLLYKVRAHIVPVPIERFVVIDLKVGIVGAQALELTLALKVLWTLEPRPLRTLCPRRRPRR